MKKPIPVQEAINQLPKLDLCGAGLKKIVQDKLIEHKQYINKNGVDMPEILKWKWKEGKK